MLINTSSLRKDIPGEIKEMFSIHEQENGEYLIKINFSSMDLLQTCLRKSYFSLVRKLQKQIKAPALIFGSGIHKAMEVWYSAPRSHRLIGSVQCDDNQAMMFQNGSSLNDHGGCARCASIFAFLESLNNQLSDLDGARSPENGMQILNNYFDVYLDDPYELVRDEQGPMCEREFELEIFSGRMQDRRVRVLFYGTIDSVFKNRETGDIILVDHKTSSSLGSDFLNRIKPNHQFAGYWMGLQKVFNLPVTSMMVNGIQVAKTKMELNRQFTTISEEEIEETRGSLLFWTEQYLIAKERQFWPMASPSACAQWGGCQFKRICELPKNLQESMIKAEFNGGTKND
jgi:hypothetical protein